jgi:hypothetical protein
MRHEIVRTFEACWFQRRLPAHSQLCGRSGKQKHLRRNEASLICSELRRSSRPVSCARQPPAEAIGWKQLPRKSEDSDPKIVPMINRRAICACVAGCRWWRRRCRSFHRANFARTANDGSKCLHPMATTSVCLDAHTAAAASDRLVRAEPSGMRVGGRAAASAFARGTVSGRAATASADGTVSRPPSLLARFLTPAVYNSLKDVRTPNGFGISDVTRSGRVNTDSSVGTLQCFNRSVH